MGAVAVVPVALASSLRRRWARRGRRPSRAARERAQAARYSVLVQQAAQRFAKTPQRADESDPAPDVRTEADTTVHKRTNADDAIRRKRMEAGGSDAGRGLPPPPPGGIPDAMQTPTASAGPLWTPRQIAKLVGVHLDTVRHWRRQGRITGHAITPRTIRYTDAEVRRLLGELGVPYSPPDPDAGGDDDDR